MTILRILLISLASLFALFIALTLIGASILGTYKDRCLRGEK